MKQKKKPLSEIDLRCYEVVQSHSMDARLKAQRELIRCLDHYHGHQHLLSDHDYLALREVIKNYPRLFSPTPSFRQSHQDHLIYQSLTDLLQQAHKSPPLSY